MEPLKQEIAVAQHRSGQLYGELQQVLRAVEEDDNVSQSSLKTPDGPEQEFNAMLGMMVGGEGW